MSNIIEQHIPCPCGKSSDAFCRYDDGHGYCFSGECEKPYFHADSDVGVDPPKQKGTEIVKHIDMSLPRGSLSALTDRSITEKTCEFYGVTVSKDGEGNIKGHAYPYHDADGKLQAVKLRNVATKEFDIKSNKYVDENDEEYKYWPDCRLFGAHLFKSGGKTVTLVEGELDALAAYQMNGSKWPVVSIKNGAQSALKDCKANYEYLNSFDNIVIVFDSDAAGKKAAKQVAQLFPGKAKVCTLQRGKDAGEYAAKGMRDEFLDEWWNAETYTPTSVIFGDALTKLAVEKPQAGTPLIWDALSKVTYGVRPHEVWTFGAGTGMGKTEIFKEIAYGLAVDHNKKSGMIFLEEQPARTWQCITGKHIEKRYYLEDVDVTQTELNEANERLKNNFVIYDHNGDTDYDSIKSKIQYFVRVLGCEYIFLDHITALAEGKEDGNVNSRIHQIMTDINNMVMADPFTVFLVSHLNQPSGTPHEEGGRVTLRNFYGSGAIKQRSNFVFGFEGNQQMEGDMRHLRKLRCLKDRNTGSATGEVINMKYDTDTGRLNEYEIDEAIVFDKGELE